MSSKESKKTGITRRPWTAKEDATILKMAKAKAKTQEIADVVNRSVASVWTRLYNLRNPKNQVVASAVAPKVKSKKGKKQGNKPVNAYSNASDDFGILKKIATERGVTITVSISA